ncbi:hypothetical protein JCM11491_002038 [Sporobolomyces phaffii]
MPTAPTTTECSRKRKSTPYRSPRSHSLETGGTVTSAINVSQLLRVLAKEHKQDQLDHQRYRPANTLPTRPEAKGSPDKKKHNPRDVLLPQDAQFGRGKRTQHLGGVTTRGRSPGIPPATSATTTRAKGKTSIPPVASSSNLKRSRSQDASSLHRHLGVPSTASSAASRSPPLLHPSVSITMNRSTSLGPSTPGPSSLSTTTTSPTESLVVINSPLARSFTSNGKGEIEERLVVEGRRSRQSSAGGSAYVSPRPSPRSQPAVAVGGLQVAA